MRSFYQFRRREATAAAAGVSFDNDAENSPRAGRGGRDALRCGARFGAGAAARYSMGLVIFSGILVGTLFTLFVVPMFYTFISKRTVAPAPDTGLAHAAPAH